MDRSTPVLASLAHSLSQEHGAHSHGGIARQTFQRLDRERKDMGVFALRKAGQQAGDLGGEFSSHFRLAIIGQQAVGNSAGAGIGGNGSAGCGRAMGGQIVQHIGARIAAPGQDILGLARAAFQNIQCGAAIERLRMCVGAFPVELRHGRLRFSCPLSSRGL